jgi:uncharacterized membrane protein YdfJ with MMPL/SSD domain
VRPDPTQGVKGRTGRPADWLDKWTDLMIRSRFIVLGTWLVIAVGGTIASNSLAGLLSTSLSVPGSGSASADSILARHFDLNPDGTFTVVVPLNKSTEHLRAQYVRDIRSAAAQIPTARIANLRTVAGLICADVVTSYDLQRAQAFTPKLRTAFTRDHLSSALVTGAPAIQHDILPVLALDLKHGELIALPILVFMLALVLGVRPLALIPLLLAGAVVGASLCAIFAIAHAFLMVAYIPNLVTLLGLGIGIDYSLLISRRYQDECAIAEDHRLAILTSMRTAGKATILSGFVVGAGLAVLLLVPVPFLRSLALAGILVPILSITAAITLQPAMLSILGHWRTPVFGTPNAVRSPDTPPKFNADSKPSGLPTTFWSRVGHGVVRHRGLTICIGLTLLFAAIVPVAWLRLTPGSTSSFPRSLAADRGLSVLAQHVGPGPISPIEIVVDFGKPGRARSKSATAITLRIATTILGDHEAFIVAIGPKFPYVDASGQYRRLTVIGRHDFGSPQTRAFVNRIRDVLLAKARVPRNDQVWVGGIPAEGVDFLNRAYGVLPWVIGLMALVMYVLLSIAFRSLLLPAIALILDALSGLASLGFVVLIFQFGIGKPLGLYHASAIEGWVPIFLIAVLFGLSMDYEVFLVSRIRELNLQYKNGETGVAGGVALTGVVITAAAIILISTLAGFVTGRIGGLQEFGVGLAVAIVLDASLVRLMLLPAVMELTGDKIWWMPNWSTVATHRRTPPLE